MSLPEITFSIPFYSGLDYLERALRSVLAQTDSAWRAFVCDDSPEPGARELVERLGDARITYRKNERTLGIGGNFNRSIDVAETDLVTVLHADDELMPNYASTMRAAATRNPQAVAHYCGAAVIGADGQRGFSLVDYVKTFINPAQRHEHGLAGEPGVRALLRANFIMAPTLCFRKSVLRERRFPLDRKFVLDWELTTSLLLDGDTIVGVPEVCYRYRRHDEATTEKLTKSQVRFREESEFYDRMRQVAERRGWDKCAALATHKRMIKLNIAYRALKSAGRLQLADARRTIGLLREL